MRTKHYKVFRHEFQGMYLMDPFTEERSKYTFEQAVRVVHAWRPASGRSAAELVPSDTNSQDATWWVRLR